jgi:hypothetical protein
LINASLLPINSALIKDAIQPAETGAGNFITRVFVKIKGTKSYSPLVILVFFKGEKQGKKQVFDQHFLSSTYVNQ